MISSMPKLDRVSRRFWQVAGRPVSLTGDQRWLVAPMHDGCAPAGDP